MSEKISTVAFTLRKGKIYMNIEKASPSEMVYRETFVMAPQKWPSAGAMDMTLARMVSWSLIQMKPPLSAGSLIATSIATVWAKLPLG